MREEVWKDIPGFEGFYQVSNLGGVRSLDRKMKIEPVSRNSYEKILKGKRLKLRVSNNGYYVVYLYKDFERLVFAVHRLVANAFLENPSKHTDLIFLDGNRFNPVATNLEWKSRSDIVKNSWLNRSRKK